MIILQPRVTYNKRVFLYLGIIILIGIIILYLFYDIPSIAMAGGILALSAGLVFMTFAFLVLMFKTINIKKELSRGEENELQ